MIKDLKKTNANNGVGEDTSSFVESEKTNDVSKISENYGISLNDIHDSDELTKINELEKFINARKDAMKTAKSGFDLDKNIDEGIYDSVTTWEAGKIAIQFPAEQIYIDGIESELGDRGLVYKVKAKEELTNINKTLPNKIVLNHFIEKDQTIKKLKDFRLDFLKYGMGVLFEGINQDKRKLKSDGSKKFNGIFLKGRNVETKTVIDFKLGSRVVNVDNFFIDDGVNNFDDANDCIEIEFKSRGDVLSDFIGDEYFNLTNVIRGLKDNDNEITRYFNVREDLYAILINDILVYEGPNPYEHKQLPYSVAIMENHKKHAYGKGGIIKKIRKIKPFINMFMNIMMKSLVNSNTSPMLMGEGVDFINESPSFGSSSTWKLSGDVNQVKQLQVKGPDGSLFNLIDLLMSFITKLIGYNPDAMNSMANVTQFQTGVVEEKATKRLGYYAKQLDYAIKNALYLKLKNIHYYIDFLSLEAILDPNLKGMKRPKRSKLILEDKELIKRTDSKGSQYYEFNDIPGAYSEFELTGDAVRGDFDIYILTNDEKPLLEELQKNDYNQVVNALQVTSQVTPELLDKIGLDIRQFFKGLLKVYNLNSDELIMDTQSKRIEEEVNKELESIAKMTEGVDQPMTDIAGLMDLGMQNQDINNTQNSNTNTIQQ